MNSKQRTLAALARQQPDRVPMYVTVVPEVAQRLSEATGIPCHSYDAYLTNRISHARLLTALGNDVVGIGATAPTCCPTQTLPDGCRVDEWQLVYRPVAHAYGVYHEIVGRPLKGIASVRELAGYRFPDPYARGRYDAAKAHCDQYGGSFAILGVLECTVFETAWNLVGLEQFLTDMALGADYVDALLDEVTQYHIAVALELLKLGADIILTGDDIATDTGPMISLDMWRHHLKPRLKRVFDACRSARRGVVMAYHSCGSIIEFIDDLVEIGLDVLNPIQITARGMSPAALKSGYGHVLAFCGAIDQRHVLPSGTVQDVEVEVRRRVAELGQGGGYLLSPTHDIQSDTPLDNVLALFESAKKWGQYPGPGTLRANGASGEPSSVPHK